MAKTNKTACVIYLQILTVALELWKTVTSIKEAVALLVKIKTFLKYGIIDSLAAELLALAVNAASQMAKNILGAVSSFASNLLSALFESLLKIFLSAPTAIFSLVAIPHDFAIESVKEERRLLLKIERAIKSIFYVINKWSDTTPKSEYYNQMKRSLSLVRIALSVIRGIITDLDLESEDDRNAKISKSKYTQLRNVLKSAIDESLPTSFLDERGEFTKKLEEKRAKLLKAKIDPINAEFTRRFGRLDATYAQDVINAGNITKQRDVAPGVFDDLDKKASTFNVGNTASRVEVDSKYQWDYKVLEGKKEYKISKARAEVEYEMVKFSGSSIASAAGGLLKPIKSLTDTEFSDDMKKIGDNLVDLLDYTVKAYGYNKESQLFCNNIYSIKSLIRKMIEWIVSQLRTAGNIAASAVSPAFSFAETLIDYTEREFSSKVEAHESPNDDVSGAELVSSLSKGHFSLILADQTLEAAVTEELIGLINADDLVESEDKRFEEFLTKLAGISDWDGRNNVWAVDIANSARNPYVQMIADVTRAVRKVPFLSFSTSDSKKSEASRLIRKVYKSLNQLRRHNIEVDTVLKSYTPFIDDRVADLRRILSMMGLLKFFALGMNLATLITALLNILKLGDFSLALGYERCLSDHPELEDDLDPDLAAMADKQYMNMPAKENINPEVFQKALEESMEDNDGDKAARSVTAQTSLMPKEKDLLVKTQNPEN